MADHEQVVPASQINRPVMRGWQLWGRPKNEQPQKLPGEVRGHEIWGQPKAEPAKPAESPAPAAVESTPAKKGKKGATE